MYFQPNHGLHLSTMSMKATQTESDLRSHIKQMGVAQPLSDSHFNRHTIIICGIRWYSIFKFRCNATHCRIGQQSTLTEPTDQPFILALLSLTIRPWLGSCALSVSLHGWGGAGTWLGTTHRGHWQACCPQSNFHVNREWYFNDSEHLGQLSSNKPPAR